MKYYLYILDTSSGSQTLPSTCKLPNEESLMHVKKPTLAQVEKQCYLREVYRYESCFGNRILYKSLSISNIYIFFILKIWWFLLTISLIKEISILSQSISE